MVRDATPEEIHQSIEQAWKAFHAFRDRSRSERAAFMRAIASGLEDAGDALIRIAMKETHLPEARLRNERVRTIFQLNSYATACVQGDWLEARIDTAIPDRNPPKPDIRKMLVPIGPVVVFGASNFPFAYSTAGGDTASAFAAGCPVIVKAHPAHPETSDAVASIIRQAVQSCNMPDGLFQHLHGASHEVGRSMVQHPRVKAVGFTGSFSGGKQLFDWAAQRTEPIPVFAEMGSVNPVFLLPGKLAASADTMATQYAGSVTLGVGQFCTNPGLIIGIASESLTRFLHDLGKALQAVTPAPMLHAGIASVYASRREAALMQPDVHLVAESVQAPGPGEGQPTLATTDGDTFLNNPILHKEVFGPFSLVVACRDRSQLLEVAQSLEGQLTCTVMASRQDLTEHTELIGLLKDRCGRLVLNGVPTGVEVCLSMQHGGPFPATTDARFGAVGADAIKRFARPFAWQNWEHEFLPDELKDQNPCGIWRTVNEKLDRS